MLNRILQAISLFLSIRDAALIARRRRPEDVRRFVLPI
jgi:hypothetical protein